MKLALSFDRDTRWDELQPVDGADARWVDFLRSGSACVALFGAPRLRKRRHCLAAVRLAVGQRRGTGARPPPGYISIGEGIRALTGGGDAGDPGDAWEVKLPTTRLWLDPDPTLPKHNPGLRVVKPQAEMAICAIERAPAKLTTHSAQAPMTSCHHDVSASSVAQISRLRAWLCG